MGFKKIDLVAFSAAYLFALEAINQLVGYILHKSSGVMIINVAVTLALLVLSFIFNRRRLESHINSKAGFFCLFYIVVFIVNSIIHKDSTVNGFTLIVYCVLPMIMCVFTLNIEKLLRYLLYISLLVIPFINNFFSMATTRTGVQVETIGMSSSYNIMVFVMAAIIHFFYYRKEGNKVLWIAYLANLYYLLRTIGFGTRGVLICYLLLFVLMYFKQYDKMDNLAISNNKRTIVVIFIAAVVIIISLNFVAILEGLNNLLISHNIKIYALSKSISKLQTGDLSNGRNAINEFIIKSLKENMVVGHGIGMINKNSGGRYIYPHNIFLQLLYDLGIIVSLPLFYMIIKAVILMVKGSRLTKEYSTALILFFSASVPKLCFSTQLWTSTAFWFLIMSLLIPSNFGQTGQLKPFNKFRLRL